MKPFRVLIVDDSTPIRTMLSGILSEESDIEVVGTAGSGAVALAKLAQLNPTVVTLDVEMPDMSGLDILAEIRKVAPRLPVIMFSSLTVKAGATTLEALARGASDYVTKPPPGGTLASSIEHVRTQLLPRIRGLGPRQLPALVPLKDTPSKGAMLAAMPVTPLGAPTGMAAIPGLRPDILAIGSSTGGPNALAELFGALNAPLPVPIVLVQHMPPLFTRLLAERLAATSPVKFREAQHGDVLKPGDALIAPGDYHMRLERGNGRINVVLDQAPPENSCRPAVDVLFRSVAQAYGSRAMALVLTGMGQDGLLGCQDIRARGGQIVVQDEATSVVWGMPGFVAKAGLAHATLPLPHIAAELRRRFGQMATGSEVKHAG